MQHPAVRLTAPVLRTSLASFTLALAGLSGCGGGNPFGNPDTISNPPPDQSGQKLSFVYFQRCINPIYLQVLSIPGSSATNTCSASGCHDDITGKGGSLRIRPGATAVPLTSSGVIADTPDTVRLTAMYRNYYSSTGSTVLGDPLGSKLLAKPLVRNILHGGGVIFADENDPNARLMRYWISRPMPAGQDEFSAAANAMFGGNDPVNGTCNSL